MDLATGTVFKFFSDAIPDALSGDTPVRGLVIGATTARVLNAPGCSLKQILAGKYNWQLNGRSSLAKHWRYGLKDGV
jgi:hypothetical protein